MKKIIIFFFAILLLTGCKIKDINKDDINSFVNNALNSQTPVINKSFKGYKFAIPRGFIIKDKKENNYVLLSNGDNYYFYIDIVAYFYNRELNIPEDDTFLLKEITYNNKKGYIKIDKLVNDEYYLKIIYNYSRIEVKTNSKNLRHTIENSIGILLSVEYNDIILKSIIGEDILDYKEENFKLFESKRESGTFLDYIEEYENYDEKNSLKDDDFIDQ